MKLVFEEHTTKGGVIEHGIPMVSVKAYVPFNEGEGTLPSLISLRSGQYTGSDIYGTEQWCMIGADGKEQTVAQVIRQAIDMYDNLKQEKFRDTGD